MDTIAHRLQIALDLRGMKQSELVEITGIGKSSISTYLSGRYEPKQRNIYKMAKALNVNEAWLMGEDVPMERDKKSNPSNVKDFDEPYVAPIVGTIPAGYPVLAFEDIEGYASIPYSDTENYFFLPCVWRIYDQRGDSKRRFGFDSETVLRRIWSDCRCPCQRG